jgi:capsule polysaccharide export protein KpsE/RkpR
MLLGKGLSGLTLVALGAIGMAVCLVGIAGLWIGVSHLQQINSRLFRQVDQLIIQVDRRAAQARDAVDGTRKIVDTLKQTVRESAAELMAGRVASLPEIDNIERRLASAMERTQELVEVSTSTAELIEQLLATIDAIASERNANLHGCSDLMATIRLTRESLANASERLADVQRSLAEIRRKQGVGVDLSEITKLSLGVVAKLDAVQSQIATFRTRLDEIKSRSAQLRDTIRGWILAGQCLILLLIAWVSAGQFCLLLQGRRLLQSPAAPASDRPR